MDKIFQKIFSGDKLLNDLGIGTVTMRMLTLPSLFKLSSLVELNPIYSFVIFRESGPVLLNNPIFCDFSERGGGGSGVPPRQDHI